MKHTLLYTLLLPAFCMLVSSCITADQCIDGTIAGYLVRMDPDAQAPAGYEGYVNHRYSDPDNERLFIVSNWTSEGPSGTAQVGYRKNDNPSKTLWRVDSDYQPLTYNVYLASSNHHFALTRSSSAYFFYEDDNWYAIDITSESMMVVSKTLKKYALLRKGQYMEAVTGSGDAYNPFVF